MSLGYGGSCRKISEDNEFVLYEYSSYNLSFENHEKNFDGLIMIRKSSLLEPERREKIRRMPGGRRKKFIKIILCEVPFEKLIESGDVRIENCNCAWRFLANGVDFVARTLCLELFKGYQREGILPDKYSFFV